MLTEPWRVENWTQNGNPTGYRVVRGSGQTLVVAEKGGFVIDIYTRTYSAPKMLKAAKRLCTRLNREAGWIVVPDAEWKTVGADRPVFNGCTTAYLRERYGAENVTHVFGSGWLRRDPNFVAPGATAGS